MTEQSPSVLDAIEFKHLNAHVAALIHEDVPTRKRFLRSSRFIPHEQVNAINETFEQLLADEDEVRPRCCMLLGASFMGKSTLIEEFARRHPAEDQPDGHSAYVPVITVQYPDRVREGIYPEILRRLNAHLPVSASGSRVRDTCLKLLQTVGCRLIIIDELNNLMLGTQAARAEGLSTIKYLINEFKRPVIVAGTVDCGRAIHSDVQMASRFRKTHTLRPFRGGREWSKVLVAFEASLPLRKPSKLHGAEMAQLLLSKTDGYMGHLSDLLTEAANYALDEGVECISVELLQDMPWNKAGDRDVLRDLD